MTDFVVHLANSKNLGVEIKDDISPMNVVKCDALALWIGSLNVKGGFRVRCSDVAFQPALIHDVIRRHDVKDSVAAAEGS